MLNPQAVDDSKLNSKIADHDIIQLSNNFIPKGLIPLEKLFDYNDVSRNPPSISPEDDIEEINIGTQEQVQNIKISTSLAPEVKYEYLKLLRKYKDVFSWSYLDLKAYDISLIEHKIPLKSEAKPYQQKLRRINLVLLPTIEKQLKKMLDAQIILLLRYSNSIAILVNLERRDHIPFGFIGKRVNLSK